MEPQDLTWRKVLTILALAGLTLATLLGPGWARFFGR